MEPKQNLFELIKSLSKSEKRYFKLYASLQKGNKIYLKLFSEIDSQKIYNEQIIKEKYRNEKFVRQLTFTKNYLYKLILRSLVTSQRKPVDTIIMEYINQSNLLLKKGLIKQYFDNLNRAFKISMAHERFNYSLQILEMQNVYTKITGSLQDNSELEGRIKSVNKKIWNFHKYNALLTKLIDIYRTGGRIRNENLRNTILKIEKHPLLKDASLAISFKAKENYYFIHQLISDFKGDAEMIYEYCLKRFDIITKHPEPFADMNINFLQDVLSYLLFHSARKNDNEKLKYYLAYLDSLPIENKSDQIGIFFVKTLVDNVIIISRKNWTDGINNIPFIKSKLKEYHENLEGDKELLILYQIVVLNIMGRRYSEALDELNNLLRNPQLKLRPELEWYARLLNLIIHFELNNYKFLRYLLISTYRYLYKKKKLFKLEKCLLNFIRKLPPSASEEQTKKLLSSLRNELAKIRNDAFEKNAFKYFDFIYWIDMKLKVES